MTATLNPPEIVDGSGARRPVAGATEEPPPRDAVSARPTTVWFGPTVCEHDLRAFLAMLGKRAGVAVVQWPRDREPVAQLAQVGIARLLLVDPAVNAMPGRELLQDWLLASATTDELSQRVTSLAERSAKRRETLGRPRLDCDGRLDTGIGWAEIPSPLRRVAHCLIDRFEQPIDSVTLGVASFCDARRVAPRVGRLREHVNPLGLEISSPAADGFVMRWARPSVSRSR